MNKLLCAAAVVLSVVVYHTQSTMPLRAADQPHVKAPPAKAVRVADVIYGRKYGMALTMDVLKPPRPNGAAVIWAVSGGFRSSHRDIAGDGFVRRMGPFLKRGYTVFAVLHGSMPKYEMREITADFHRAARFIRHGAKEFGVDPGRIGISGASAGGSISLMMGTTGGPGNPRAKDPVDRESSRVQAVACFFPGTDWVNWEKDGVNVLGTCQRMGLIEGFRFRKYDPKLKEHVLITDPKAVEAILWEYSAINHVTAQSAPTLIIHGDADATVPLPQAERMVAKLKAAHVPAELIVKKGKGHGWPNMAPDMARLADWYDKHLDAPKTAEPVRP